MTVVDYQSHWLPPSCLQDWTQRKRYPRVEMVDGDVVLELHPEFRFVIPPPLRDLDVQRVDADEHGIDVVVSSPAFLGEVLHLDPIEAGELCEQVNQANAAAQTEHADWFVGLAMLPMQDTATAIAALDHAIVELGLAGVCMLASVDGRNIAGPETLPVFRRIEELGVPVFLHPCVRSNTLEDLTVEESGLAWMYHTARAMLSLVDSGTLDACPELTVVHPHLGGMLPYQLDRVDMLRRVGPTATEGARPVREYLREQVYTDTGVPTRGAMPLAAEVYGVDRILYATDYPFAAPRSEPLRQLGEHGFREAVLGNRLPGLKLPSDRTTV